MATDALLQTFQMNYSTSPNIPGTYLTSLGVFFKNKSETFGIACVIYGTTNGYPDSSKNLGSGYLTPDQIITSDDSSAESKFLFSTPIMIQNDQLYAFALLPDAGSPDFDVFTSELGGTDLLTGNLISTQPYSGTLFTTSNQTTFVPNVTTEIKFNLYRAKFKYNQATLVFRNQNIDNLTLEGYKRYSTSIPLQIGDEVYAVNTSTGELLTNTAIYPYGKIFTADELSQEVQLINTTGNFNVENYPMLKIFRSPEPGNTSYLTSNDYLIATANLQSIDNISYHSLVPKFVVTEPAGSSVTMNYQGTSNTLNGSVKDISALAVHNEQRYDFTDYERSLLSYSNERHRIFGSYGANGTGTVIINMYSSSPYSSPVLDTLTKRVNYISNQINNLADNEDTIYGDALNKYISQPVVMNITAEDLRFYLIGYRPLGTNINVYARFRNNHDSSLLKDNPWSQLYLDPTQTNLYSSSKDQTDYQEYNYYIPVGNTVANQTIAYMDPHSQPQANTLTYFGTSGAQYDGFDSFQIKVVLLSDDQIKYPTLKSISAIALLQ